MSGSWVFSVWRFSTAGGAQRAVHTLVWPSGLQVEDAAVVSWPAEQPRPTAWQTPDLTGQAALDGAFWGMLIGVFVLLPLSKRSATPAPPFEPEGSASEYSAFAELGLLGFDATFAASVRRRIVPGCSALFVLEASTDATALRRAMPPETEEIARVHLTAEHMAALRYGFES